MGERLPDGNQPRIYPTGWDGGERVIEIERHVEVPAFDILHDQVVRPYSAR